jgi:hypothetical protein
VFEVEEKGKGGEGRRGKHTTSRYSVADCRRVGLDARVCVCVCVCVCVSR